MRIDEYQVYWANELPESEEGTDWEYIDCAETLERAKEIMNDEWASDRLHGYDDVHYMILHVFKETKVIEVSSPNA